jgi:hypothetical protein
VGVGRGRLHELWREMCSRQTRCSRPRTKHARRTGLQGFKDGRWLPLRLGGVARRGTRKGCVSKQLRITAAQENALTPAPARTTILTGRDPPHAGRACTGTGTGTGLFSSLVFRDGSASREARAWRGWQPIEGEVHGEKVQISAVCIKVGMTENAPRVHASSALGARVQWLAF